MSEILIEVQRARKSEAILVLAGDVDLSCVDAIWDVAADALLDKPERLVIDLSAVTFANSSVLGTLIQIQTVGNQQGTVVVLRHPTPIVRRLLHLSRLEDVLPLDDEPESI